jgi:hypothetical protein
LRTVRQELHSGMLVFFTFMPLGALIDGISGALSFGLPAIYDNKTEIEREQAGPRDRRFKGK